MVDTWALVDIFQVFEDSSGRKFSSPQNYMVSVKVTSIIETYIFKANNVCTIRSDSGSIDSTYRFIKTGQNTAVLSIPADDAAGPDSILGTADDVIATKYKLTFSSSSSGTISGGRAGNFSYYPEGTSAPSTKGWIWFDEYPWVYSHVEGGWLYFNPSGSKLMVFSVKDQAWREMTK